jgi:hypothetical protein
VLPPWRLTRSVEAARVHIDLSASMQGFDRRKTGPFYGAMLHLKDALVKEGIPNLYGSGFGTDVGSPVSMAGPVELLGLPASEKNTCLARPLESYAQVPPADSPLLIIVTDGVTSAAQGACGKNCAQGSDAACVASALTTLARKGRGIWLVGLRLPFAGQYYPEQGGRSFRVLQGTNRPLYLWIVSPDFRVGRRVAAAMAAWARNSLAADRVLAAEVWPGQWLGYRVADQPPSGWRSSDFSAFDYGDTTRRQPGVAIASVHRQSCELKTPRGSLAPPYLCLQKIGGSPVWIGQIPVVATDGGDAALPEIPALLAMRAPIQLRQAGSRAVSSQPTPTPIVPTGCLSVDGIPVLTDQVRVSNTRWILGCLEPLPSSQRNGVAYRLLAAIEPNDSAGMSAVDLEWTGTPDLHLLAAWDTDDDSSSAAIGRTLGLRRLWGLVTDILAGAHSQTRLIEFGWAPTAGG